MNRRFWHDKKVFVTGHTGFKGGWLCTWLEALGAQVCGFALEPDTQPSFFESCRLASRIQSVIGDIRDEAFLAGKLAENQPEIVFHLAAQPLVRRSYRQPLETFTTNIIGTAHLLEAVRQTPSVRAVVVITSDKCYENQGWFRGYQETDPLGGRDPYSASKGCTELVAAAYQHSYFRKSDTTIATARAGNVIGGGDWAQDRLVPDAIQSFSRNEPLAVRNPGAVRPWQHVLEPLAGYIMLAEKVFSEREAWAGGWNFGPDDSDAVPVSTLASRLAESWGKGASWIQTEDVGAAHEEAYLTLDSSKARQCLGWHPVLSLAEAVRWTVSWYQRAQNLSPEGLYTLTHEQIRCFETLGTHKTP